MSRWITQAVVVFGVALSETAGNPLKLSSGRPSLSNGAPDGYDGINTGHVAFEYLNQCAEANLSKDSCLVSKTLEMLMGGDDGPESVMPTAGGPDWYPAFSKDWADGTCTNDLPVPEEVQLFSSQLACCDAVFDGQTPNACLNDVPGSTMPPTPSPSSTSGARFLQEDCDGPPDVDEQDLRSMMNGSKAQCIQSGLAVSDEEFESSVAGFLKIFGSDSCFEQLCDEESNPSAAVFEIMFDQLAECAQVELDIPQCLMDQVLGMMFSEDNSDNMSNEVGGDRRRLQALFGCEQPSAVVVSQGVGVLLSVAQLGCSESGVDVSSEVLTKATSDLTTIFMAEHCSLGDDNDCGDSHDSDDGQHALDAHYEGLNYFNIAFKYVEQCAGLDVNMDTCLATGTIDAFSAMGDESSHSDDQQENGNQGEVSRRRFLQMSSDGEECVAPVLNELTLRYIIEGSKGQCIQSDLSLSEQNFEETVDDFMDLFSATDCWVSLCEEDLNPSEIMLKLVFEQIGECAGADLDFNPCLMDQMLELIFSSDSPYGFDAVRRKLEQTVDSPEENEDCPEPPGDAEVSFLVNLVVTGAEEKCVELGETFEAGEIDMAGDELFKLFSTHHCWCNDDHGEHHVDSHGHDNEYLEFVEESTTWMLGDCVGVTDTSCVFSRSIEVMHGMKRLGWTHDGHTNPQNLVQESLSSICTSPSLEEYDIKKIADHAKEHCIEAGKPVEDYHYDQAANDLNNLVAKPDCWEDLCKPEMKDIIVEEWMHECAFVDLEFLTTDEPIMSAGVSLDSDMLRCMAHYIVSEKRGTHANLACGLSHLEVGVCNIDMGKKAYINCGGEIETYSPTSSPSSSSTSLTTSPTSSSTTSSENMPSSSPTAPPTLRPTHSLAPSKSRPQSASPSNQIQSNLPSVSPSVSQLNLLPVPLSKSSKSPSSSPSNPPTSLSMSFAYSDGSNNFNWALGDDEEAEMSMSISMPSLMMGMRRMLPNDDNNHEDNAMPTTLSPTPFPSVSATSELSTSDSGLSTQVPTGAPTYDLKGGGPFLRSLYIKEVCSLIETLNSDVVQHCLEPACNGLWIEHTLTNDDNDHEDNAMPTTSGPTPFPSVSATSKLPTGEPEVSTQVPTTLKPTKKPTRQPTPSPTVLGKGEIEVTVEVKVTLEGIEMSDIDIASIDKVKDLLSTVLRGIIPEGAILRILKIGGFSVTRRILRFLEDDGGVPIEFEIIMKQTCETATCEGAEDSKISDKLYKEVTADLTEKVESGELTTAIQEEAEEQGVSELSNVTINASTMQVSEAKVAVKEAKDDLSATEPPTSSSSSLGGVLSMLAVVASMMISLCS